MEVTCLVAPPAASSAAHLAHSTWYPPDNAAMNLLCVQEVQRLYDGPFQHLLALRVADEALTQLHAACRAVLSHAGKHTTWR